MEYQKVQRLTSELQTGMSRYNQ